MQQDIQYNYQAYGLGVSSSLMLPEFVAADSGEDVVIQEHSRECLPEEVREAGWYLRFSLEEAIVAFKDVAVFVIRRGCEITIVRSPGVDDGLLRLCLTGTIMALLMYQRGRLVLHASAIQIGRGGIAITGNSGQGKSSLAAALCGRGHSLLSDDVTPTVSERGAISAIPAFPQLKLTGEVAERLGHTPESLIQLHSTEEKRGCRVNEWFAPEPVPLQCVYVLRTGSHASIELLRPQEALTELILQTYPTRLQRCGGPEHFVRCAELVRSVPVYALQRSSHLSELPYLARLVEDHFHLQRGDGSGSLGGANDGRRPRRRKRSPVRPGGAGAGRAVVKTAAF
jgi:hypothetical protein